MSIVLRKVVPAVVLLSIGGVLGYLLHPVEDYWPHNYPMTGAHASADQLAAIVDRAVAEILSPPAGQQPNPHAIECIGLALRCAWQDLQGQDAAYRQAHAEAVARAYASVLPGPPVWETCKEQLTAAPAASGVNHPH